MLIASDTESESSETFEENSKGLNDSEERMKNCREQMELEKRKKELFEIEIKRKKEQLGGNLNPTIIEVFRRKIYRQVEEDYQQEKAEEEAEGRSVSFMMRDQSQTRIDLSCHSEDLNRTVAVATREPKKEVYSTKGVETLLKSTHMFTQDFEIVPFTEEQKSKIARAIKLDSVRCKISASAKALLMLGCYDAEEIHLDQTTRFFSTTTSAWKSEMSKLEKRICPKPTLEQIIFLGKMISSGKCLNLSEPLYGYTLEMLLISMYLQRVHTALVDGKILPNSQSKSYCWAGRIDTIPQPSQLNLKIVLLIITALLKDADAWDSEYRGSKPTKRSDEGQEFLATDQIFGHILDTVGVLLIRLLDCINMALLDRSVHKNHMLSITHEILLKRINQLENYYSSIEGNFKPFMMAGHRHRKTLGPKFIGYLGRYKNIKKVLVEQHVDSKK